MASLVLVLVLVLVREFVLYIVGGAWIEMLVCLAFNTDGATLQIQTPFNFSGLSSWMGETGQRKELGYTSSETPKSAQLGGVGPVRRREFAGFGIFPLLKM